MLRIVAALLRSDAHLRSQFISSMGFSVIVHLLRCASSVTAAALDLASHRRQSRDPSDDLSVELFDVLFDVGAAASEPTTAASSRSLHPHGLLVATPARPLLISAQALLDALPLAVPVTRCKVAGMLADSMCVSGGELAAAALAANLEAWRTNVGMAGMFRLLDSDPQLLPQILPLVEQLLRRNDLRPSEISLVIGFIVLPAAGSDGLVGVRAGVLRVLVRWCVARPALMHAALAAGLDGSVALWLVQQASPPAKADGVRLLGLILRASPR